MYVFKVLLPAYAGMTNRSSNSDEKEERKAPLERE